MKPQIFALTTHHPESLKSLIKKATDQGQSVAKAGGFVAFNPSEAMAVDMTPKEKAFRRMTVAEQVQSNAAQVPGSLESILSRVDMGDN